MLTGKVYEDQHLLECVSTRRAGYIPTRWPQARNILPPLPAGKVYEDQHLLEYVFNKEGKVCRCVPALQKVPALPGQQVGGCSLDSKGSTAVWMQHTRGVSRVGGCWAFQRVISRVKVHGRWPLQAAGVQCRLHGCSKAALWTDRRPQSAGAQHSVHSSAPPLQEGVYMTAALRRLPYFLRARFRHWLDTAKHIGKCSAPAHFWPAGAGTAAALPRRAVALEPSCCCAALLAEANTKDYIST